MNTPSNAEALFRAGYEAAQRDEDKPGYAIGLDPAGDAWEDYAATLPPQDSSGDAWEKLVSDLEAALSHYIRNGEAQVRWVEARERLLAALSRQDRPAPDDELRKALVETALAAWRALPEDERNGERPFIMGFNAGWNAALASRSAPDGWVLPADQRLRMFLEILAAAGGEADASDGPFNCLNAFCEEHEGRDPDTFNIAINRGFTRTAHNDLHDTSTVYLTEAGRAFLAAAPPAPSGEGVWDADAGRFYSAEHLRQLLDGRDRFIVAHGLWSDFVKSVEVSPSSPTLSVDGHTLPATDPADFKYPGPDEDPGEVIGRKEP